jgi:hypothetical protein
MPRADVWFIKNLVGPKQEYCFVFGIKCPEDVTPDNKGFLKIEDKTIGTRMQYSGGNFDPEEIFRPKSSGETTRRAQCTAFQNDLV